MLKSKKIMAVDSLFILRVLAQGNNFMNNVRTTKTLSKTSLDISENFVLY